MSYIEPDMHRKSDVEQDPVTEMAARWWVTLHDQPVSPEVAGNFESWLHSDPRHEEAYRSVEQLWAASAQTATVKEARRTYSRRQMIKKLAFVGSAGLAASVGMYCSKSNYLFADYRTAIGQTRSLTLSDGSTVELSTNTSIDLQFDLSNRIVRLHEGEIYCKVVKDPERPFTVESRFGSVTALGTQFGVLIDRSHARVAVTEHSVRVASRESNLVLQQGQLASTNGVSIAGPEPLQPSLLAWRSGRIEFLSQPLREVIATIEHWRRGKILLTDSTLGRMPVTMLMDLRRISEAIAKLSTILPVTVVELTPWLTVIRRA